MIGLEGAQTTQEHEKWHNWIQTEKKIRMGETLQKTCQQQQKGWGWTDRLKDM